MKMNKGTLAALCGSIEKWEAIAEWRGEDKGPDNCPLCEKFFDRRHPEVDFVGCYGCPVSAHTGWPSCTNTPYDDWLDAVGEEEYLLSGYSGPRGGVRLLDPDYRRVVIGPKSQKAAEAELAFLRSLLPQKEKE